MAFEYNKFAIAVQVTCPCGAQAFTAATLPVDTRQFWGIRPSVPSVDVEVDISSVPTSTSVLTIPIPEGWRTDNAGSPYGAVWRCSKCPE